MYFIAGLVRSTVLYAALMAIVGVALGALGGDIAATLGLVYAVLLVAHSVFVSLTSRRRARHLRQNVFSAGGGALGADISRPFRGLTALVGMRKVVDTKGLQKAMSWTGQWVHLIWSVLLFATCAAILFAWK